MGDDQRGQAGPLPLVEPAAVGERAQPRPVDGRVAAGMQGHEMSYRQALTPDALQARTNTTMRSFNRAVIVVVAPLGGLLADLTSARSALLLAAGVFGLSAVMLLLSPFRTATAV